MVYTIMMQGGCWFIYLLLGRGDEHVYVYACPRGGYTPQVGMEGAVLVVFVLFFGRHVWVYHTSRKHGLLLGIVMVFVVALS